MGVSVITAAVGRGGRWLAGGPIRVGRYLLRTHERARQAKLPPSLTRENQTRRGKDDPSMFVTPTARVRCTSATTNGREYVIVDDVAALVHANRRDWNARSFRMSRKRHAVQRLRKLHRSFGAGPR